MHRNYFVRLQLLERRAQRWATHFQIGAQPPLGVEKFRPPAAE
jgi:hypothetical protein